MIQQHWTRRVLGLLLLVQVLLLTPWTAAAQDTGRSSFLVDVAKQVVLDPTTYAPSLIGYDATQRDWATSQPFFRNGYLERNPRFTVSGLPNDVAVSYGEAIGESSSTRWEIRRCRFLTTRPIVSSSAR